MAQIPHDRHGLIPIRRVVLIGSECTGKTTLAQRLAAQFDTVWVPEFGRAYVDLQRAPLVYEDVERIAHGQIAAEEAAAPGATRVLILDTDLVSTMVYSRHYYGRCPEWVEDAARARRGHLYLLHHPDVPWVADGLQRDRPLQRHEMHGLFRDALAEIGATLVDVAGSWAARAATAEDAVRALLAAPAF
jgi:NadR type nicotinamide-nucleotide adenylyltransferase